MVFWFVYCAPQQLQYCRSLLYTSARLPDKLLLDDRGYSHVLDADQYTDVSIDNMEGGRCADNIWLSRGVQSAHTGSAFNC